MGLPFLGINRWVNIGAVGDWIDVVCMWEPRVSRLVMSLGDPTFGSEGDKKTCFFLFVLISILQ